jgi:hypothetical protein
MRAVGQATPSLVEQFANTLSNHDITAFAALFAGKEIADDFSRSKAAADITITTSTAAVLGTRPNDSPATSFVNAK